MEEGGSDSFSEECVDIDVHPEQDDPQPQPSADLHPHEPPQGDVALHFDVKEPRKSLRE